MARSDLAYSAVLEWALAALEWGLDWWSWQQIDTEDQAFMIAAYRARHQMDAVVATYPKRRRIGGR